jgi:hypothetical protein
MNDNANSTTVIETTPLFRINSIEEDNCLDAKIKLEQLEPDVTNCKGATTRQCRIMNIKKKNLNVEISKMDCKFPESTNTGGKKRTKKRVTKRKKTIKRKKTKRNRR